VRAATIFMKVLNYGLSIFHLTLWLLQAIASTNDKVPNTTKYARKCYDTRASAVEYPGTVTSTTAPCLNYRPSLSLRGYFEYRKSDRSRSVNFGRSAAPLQPEYLNV
jgi:hypothetical protein